MARSPEKSGRLSGDMNVSPAAQLDIDKSISHPEDKMGKGGEKATENSLLQIGKIRQQKVEDTIPLALCFLPW